MLSTYSEEIQTTGFATVPRVLDSEAVACIIEQLRGIQRSDSTKQRGSSYFGVRKLLSVVPSLQELVSGGAAVYVAEHRLQFDLWLIQLSAIEHR